MPKLSDTLLPTEQLALAVHTKSPAGLARTFAAYVGQFYDRSDFDALARRVSALYATESAERAQTFRARLDRRLHDRYHTPVAWEVAPVGTEQAA